MNARPYRIDEEFNNMRAEAQNMVDEIRASLSLLRRHL